MMQNYAYQDEFKAAFSLMGQNSNEFVVSGPEKYTNKKHSQFTMRSEVNQCGFLM